MPTEPPPVTLFQVVRKACEVVDPDDRDATVGDFEMAFEDADEPVRALDDVEDRVADVLQRLDPAVANGALSVAGAVVTYLAFRRDEVGAQPDELVRLAARAEWDGDPPEPVQEWLDDRGIRI